MQLLEYEAKMIFSQQGIAISRGELIQSLEELRELSGKFSFPVVLKAQVPVGGRKKVGGIMIAHDQNDVEAGVRSLLGMRIRGCMVRKILLEKYLNTEREAYLSVSIDACKGTPLILASSLGGVDIEDITRIHPEKVAAKTVDIACGLSEDIAAELARRTKLEDISLEKIVDTLKRLYEIFVKYDALLVEANPFPSQHDDSG
jgi:succinyl-CoA synthetase beta subunit